MTLMRRIRWIFWNQAERRLRAVWRILAHTITLFALTTAFTIGLTLLTLVADAVLNLGLGENLLQSGSMRIMQVPWVFMVIIPFATFLGVLLATIIAGKFFDHRELQSFGLDFSKGWWIDFAFGLGLGAFLMILIFLFGWLTGNVRITDFFQSVNPDQNFISGFLQAMIFFIFVGIYEELLSRGYHLVNLSEGFNLKFLGKRWAVILAVIASSGVFGILHLRNPNASWVSTLNITVAGMVFSLGIIFSRRLAIPIGLHITWNFFQGNVFGFPVSGTRNGATLIGTEAVGPEWLTGGAFGPEAGLMGLAAMLLGGLLTLLWIKRTGPLSVKTELAAHEPREGKADN